jgi:hypothetical protein
VLEELAQHNGDAGELCQWDLNDKINDEKNSLKQKKCANLIC